ncbi:MAG: NAD(P)-dependent oxidoreductase [Patescibacteria group bacterium]
MPKKYTMSFYGIMPDMKTYLRQKMKKNNLNIFIDPIEEKSLEKIDKNTEILGVFVDSKVDKKVFEKLPKLKMITTFSTGFDHIDLKEAKKRKITVCNVPTYGENTVAQHALALILALSRKLFQSLKRVKEGVYDYHGLCGFDLKDKTIGIVGTGHIGIHLIRMLQGFDANIIAFDVFPNKELEKKYNFKYVSKNKLFQESDIISLHLPLFPETHHIVDKKAVKMMKTGVYIINTARGGLIDSEAIVAGLDSKKIAGFAADVLEDEGLIENPELLISNKRTIREIKVSLMNNVLIDHPKTIITPHNAFNSIEALKRIFDTSIENINSFLEEKIINEVKSK